MTVSERSGAWGAQPSDGCAFYVNVPETFEVFYRRELPALVALASALSGSATAEDLAQDAMLAAYRHWGAVCQLDVPAAWVRRVCANRAVSILRRRAAESRAPRWQTQVIALHYIYDLSVKDIAATLNCAEGTVQVHLFRARAALAQQFEATEGDGR